MIAASTSIQIRSAQPGDAPAIFALIQALADYEKLAHQVVGTVDLLDQHLFGDRPYIETLLALDGEQAIGFALFFTHYSTALTRPGFYLEDLFVAPDYRGQGIGKALLSRLAQLAIERNYGRLSWSVLDWNSPAIGFYQKLGTTILDDIRICRLSSDGDLPDRPGLDRTSPDRTSPDLTIRPATLADFAEIAVLVKDNNEFDGTAFQGDLDALQQHLFGDRPYAETFLAERQGTIAGLALCHASYSTFLTRPGLFIEDLFVAAEHRRQGIGTALLHALAQQTRDRQYGRLEWLVRTWNQPAIDCYQRLGAAILPDWRICMTNRAAIRQLAGDA